MLNIKIDTKGVQRQLKKLASDKDKAIVRAINRTADSARAEMVRKIRERYEIRATAVREKLRVRRATRSSPTAILEATGKKSVNLIRFNPRKVKRTPGGLSVKILKSKGRILVKGAFIANQGRTVFRRVGKSRLPITALPAMGVPQMFSQKEINATVRASVAKNLKKNIDHELRYAMGEFNR